MSSDGLKIWVTDADGIWLSGGSQDDAGVKVDAKDGGATDAPSTTDAGGQDSGSLSDTQNAATAVVVSPSASTATVTLGRGVAVTLPGGFLSAPATFHSAEVLRLPRDLTGPTEVLGAFEVSCTGCPTVAGDAGAAGFGQDITLEFAYDPAKLDPGLDEGKGLFVAYWDDDRQNWTTVPFQVDTAADKLIVKTDHLTTWVYWTMRGYKSVTSAEGHFDVYYNPKHTVPPAGAAGVDMRGFAARVGEIMEVAYGRYKGAGFTMPWYLTTSTIKVVVTDDLRWVWETWDLGGYNPASVSAAETSPYFSAVSGNVFLKLAQLADETQVSTDGAHELFHAIQNQYVNVKKMEWGLWWYEGTPDYSSYAVAWQKVLPLDRFYEATPADYFATPLTENDGTHAYQMVRFLDYLNVKYQIGFKPLWDAVMSKSDLLGGLEAYVSSNSSTTFATAWRNYVAWMFFDPAASYSASAMTKYLASGTLSLSYGFPALAGSYSAAALLVKAKMATGQTTRDVKVSVAAALPSDVDVEVWLLAGGVKAAGSASLKGVLSGSALSTSAITLGTTDELYVIAMNGGKTSQTVAVKVEEPEPTTTPTDTCKFPSGGGGGLTLGTQSIKCYDSKSFSLCFALNTDGTLGQAAEESGCQSFADTFTVTGSYTCNSVNLNFTVNYSHSSDYPGCSLTSTVTENIVYTGSVAATWDPTAETYTVGTSSGTLSSGYTSPSCTVDFPTCTASDLKVTSVR
jgi:hypothetical protein